MSVAGVEKVNALTKRWLAAVGGESAAPGSRTSAPVVGGESAASGSRTDAVVQPGEAPSTVLSGIGVWPLLAFIADAADEPGRTELATALGFSADEADEAAAAARAVLESVADSPAIQMALGLWTKPEIPLEPAWLDRLPPGTSGRLADDPAESQKRLDAWASDRTEGLIPRFPLTLDSDIVLVLASALMVATTWIEPFQPAPMWPRSGPWVPRRDRIAALRRSTKDLTQVRVADTPAGRISALSNAGTDDIDVHLVLGAPQRAAAEVMAAGVDLVSGRYPAFNAAELTEETEDFWPGVRVRYDESTIPGDWLHVLTVAFRVQSSHDLLRHAELFGLVTVSDRDRGHFPGISGAFPLAVGQAKQNAMALFTEKGFKAAAVTAIGMRVGAAAPMRPPTAHRVKHVSVTFDRPFAFYAVHRPTGLILAAGWVAEPYAETSSGSA